MGLEDFYEWDGKEIKVYRLSELMNQYGFDRDVEAFIEILSHEGITSYKANWATRPEEETLVTCRIVFIEWSLDGGQINVS
jgi:hypothetical protein